MTTNSKAAANTSNTNTQKREQLTLIIHLNMPYISTRLSHTHCEALSLIVRLYVPKRFLSMYDWVCLFSLYPCWIIYDNVCNMYNPGLFTRLFSLNFLADCIYCVWPSAWLLGAQTVFISDIPDCTWFTYGWFVMYHPAHHLGFIHPDFNERQ